MKILWFDTETTGIFPSKHSMVQLAAVVDIDGKAVEIRSFNFKPLEGRSIDKASLTINNLSEKDILNYPEAKESILELKKFLGHYVDKYNTADKFVPAGYNIRFDVNFLYSTWKAAGDKYGPGSYIFSCPIDVMSLVGMMVAKGMRLQNYKLETLCKSFGVDLFTAHDAVSDIKATRRLYYKLIKELGVVR